MTRFSLFALDLSRFPTLQPDSEVQHGSVPYPTDLMKYGEWMRAVFLFLNHEAVG